MGYFIQILSLLIFPTLLFSQSQKDDLLSEKKQIEADIKQLKASLRIKAERLSQIEKEIAEIELEELKNGDLKVSIGDREPFLLEDEQRQIGKLQKNEVVTVIAYATNIDRIKVYSPSLDKIGFLIPLVFKDDPKVQVFIQKEENKICFNSNPNPSSEPKPQSYSSSPSKSNTNYKSQSTATRRYIRGPKGGCYYINNNGKKTYVDRSYCN